MLEVFSSARTYSNFIREDRALEIVHKILHFLVANGERVKRTRIHVVAMFTSFLLDSWSHLEFYILLQGISR